MQTSLNEVKRSIQYIKDYNKEFEDNDEINRKTENDSYRDNKLDKYMENNNYNTFNQNKIFNNSNIIDLIIYLSPL